MIGRVIFTCILIGILNTPQVFGRKCWYCKNARGNEECFRIGHLIECLPNQRYCQNEIRAIGGGKYFEITKRCKQNNACANNKMQNFTGTVPFQCDTEKPHSVCRCCCDFDNCNGPEVACLKSPPSCPEPPDAPINGFVICPSHLVIGARCQFRCRAGYKRDGPSSTECTSSGRDVFWSNGPPRCFAEPCRALVAPDNGDMTCTDEWNIGSECTFTCDAGRVLIGRRTLKCSIFSKWDGEEPTCRVVSCLPPRPLDPNFVPRRGECTDLYNFNSVCTFTCHPDYDMIGDDQLTCGLPINRRNRATWDKRPPRCRKKICLPRYCATNKVGDSCTFDCDRCQRLDGNSEITCTRDGWTGEPGTCVAITCAAPPAAPENGRIQCASPRNQCDESCRYTCNSGYRLVGNPRITCLQSGLWSGPAPICELSECEPIRITGITASCSDGRSVGSQCTLTCDRGNFEFIGRSQVRCKKDATDPLPVWEPELTQYCRPILCPNFPRPREAPAPEAGTLTCGLPSHRVDRDRDGREGWRVGAQCNIQCNDLYQPKYLITESDCTANGNWTVSTLCCVRCLPNSALDVVVLLDNTEPAFWNARLEFLGELMQFMTLSHQFNLNITFIPFGDDVDLANDVEFMRIDDDINIQETDFLVERFAGIPSAAGQDSNSGKALREALDNIFGFHNFRVPVIFLFTTKVPSDLAVARAAAQELRDRKIHLRIFPVIGNLEADAGSSRGVFRQLVEDEMYLIEGLETTETADNFYLLSDDGLITVTERLCNERAQDLQTCVFAR